VAILPNTQFFKNSPSAAKHVSHTSMIHYLTPGTSHFPIPIHDANDYNNDATTDRIKGHAQFVAPHRWDSLSPRACSNISSEFFVATQI